MCISIKPNKYIYLLLYSLNDINTDLKNQVTQDKQQLIQINNQAKFYEKKYNDAIISFKKALEVKDFILSKKYEFKGVKLYPLDTAIVYNIAISAMQDKDEEEAVNNFKICYPNTSSGQQR